METPVIFRRTGDAPTTNSNSKSVYEKYFEALEAYHRQIADLSSQAGVLDLDALQEEDRDISLLRMKPSETRKLLLRVNRKLYDIEVTDDASQALIKIESEFIPMPQKPNQVGSVYGTVVFTITAHPSHEMMGRFDIMQIE